MKRTLLVVATLVVVALLVGYAVSGRLTQDLFVAIAFGWLIYLSRVLPNVAIDRSSVAASMVCLVLFMWWLHRMLRWFTSEIQRSRPVETRREWLPRWTFSIVTLIVLMFVVGIAATGIAHQGGWLLASRRPLIETIPIVEDRWGSSKDHLRQLRSGSFGIMFYEDMFGHENLSKTRFPISWMYKMLNGFPISVGGELRKDLPWTDPHNSAFYKTIIPFYLNPEIPLFRTKEGYALSHYAGNVHMLEHPAEVFLSGGSNRSPLIVAGEIAEGFKAWGDPTNVRDLELGINKIPGGFGGPSGTGANFLFTDGSVRFLTESTDPEILRQMSTP